MLINLPTQAGRRFPRELNGSCATGPTTSPTVTHKNAKDRNDRTYLDRESCNREIEHKRQSGYLFDAALLRII